MPRPLTPAVVTAIESAYVKPAILVQITLLTGPLYIWNGVGPLSWSGATFQGVGQFGNISSIEEGSNVQARGITLTLSGFDPSLISDALNEYKQGLPVNVWLAFFDASGNVVPDPIGSWSGRTDQPIISVDGPTAILAITCENRLIDMNVAVSRRYTHMDQQIDFPGDLGMSYVDAIQQLTLYWGRAPHNHNNDFGV